MFDDVVVAGLLHFFVEVYFLKAWPAENFERVLSETQFRLNTFRLL